MEKPVKKCEKCLTANVNVWFSTVSGKGKVSKHRYCKECAKAIGSMRQPPPTPQPISGPQKDLLDVAADSLFGKKEGIAKSETPESKIKRLNAAMQKAIAKEEYEACAKLRDEIEAIQKGIPKKAT